MQRTQLRIVAGSLRGRKLTVAVHPGMRPTPQAVREALFSILGNAVPDRPFVDLFAGTGVNGLEALSRGASAATFVERDHKLAETINGYLRSFGVAYQAQLIRSDVYRWAERWRPPAGAANVFLSPPFADLQNRPADFLHMVERMQAGLAVGSVLVLQLEEGFDLTALPDADRWDRRKYGRNLLLFWEPAEPAAADGLENA
jgi:16S rRNA (guanine966-N2)-methyltransferase